MSNPGDRNSKAAATIGRNAWWIGIEAGAALLTTFATSIAVARTFGPSQLGYFNFVVWFSGMSASFASLGLPITTAKYMAEFLGRGEHGVARTVFSTTLRAQMIVALCITLIEEALVFTVFNPAYRQVSAVIVAGIIPQMVAYIPSQANNAAERFRSNVPGSLAGMGVYTLGVILSLLLGWGLLGVAASMLLCHVTEMALKFGATLPWVLAHRGSPLPASLRGRMFSFSMKSFALLLVNLVVWDRSDVLFLKWLNPDIRQIAFFSVPFSLVEKTLMAPQTLATSIGATVDAERGRSPLRMLRIAELSMKYVLLGSIPLLCGLAALSRSAIGLLYGAQYAPAAAVLTVLAALAIAKSTFIPAQVLHTATERLGTVLWAATVGGLINILLDIALVPRFGALGASIANGLAQLYTATRLWQQASRTWHLKTDFRGLAKMLLCGIVMAAGIAPFTWLLSPQLAVPTGVIAGAALYLLMVRVMEILSPEDHVRVLEAWPIANRIGPLGHLIRAVAGNRAPIGVSVGKPS